MFEEFVKHQIEPGNILEISAVASQQSESMLNRLACKPEVLHSIPMLATCRFNRGCQRTKYLPASAIYG